MTFGSFTYGSSAIGASPVMVYPYPPSCNLIVMELLEQYPGYLNLDEISRYINSII